MVDGAEHEKIGNISVFDRTKKEMMRGKRIRTGHIQPVCGDRTNILN